MTHKQTTPVVIFGTGPLGLSVMDELIGRGHTHITLVNRTGRLGEPLPAGVQVMAADATDPAQVAAVGQDAAVVFHCAQPGYTQWPTAFPPITNGIVQGVGRTRAKLVMGDNLYMYGPTAGRPVTEALPYAAQGHKGRVRGEMAQGVLQAHQAGQVRATLGRASDFYGPRVLDSALGDLVFAAALANKPINLLGDIDQPHTYTFIRDFARGLVTLGEQELALGQAWHVPSAPTMTTRQILAIVEQQVGHPLRLRVAGRRMVGVLGLFNPTIREFKELMYEWEEPYVVEHGRFAQAFGSHITPHEQAIAETLAWFKKNHHA